MPVFSTDGMVLSFPILVKPLQVLSDSKNVLHLKSVSMCCPYSIKFSLLGNRLTFALNIAFAFIFSNTGFIKLNRDNELISILSLGLGLKAFKTSLMFFCISIIIFLHF